MVLRLTFSEQNFINSIGTTENRYEIHIGKVLIFRHRRNNKTVLINRHGRHWDPSIPFTIVLRGLEHKRDRITKRCSYDCRSHRNTVTRVFRLIMYTSMDPSTSHIKKISRPVSLTYSSQCRQNSMIFKMHIKLLSTFNLKRLNIEVQCKDDSLLL